MWWDPAIVLKLQPQSLVLLCDRLDFYYCCVDPDYPASGVNINLSTPHLDKLWTYSCSLTKRRKVTCMAWNNSNQVGQGCGLE